MVHGDLDQAIPRAFHQRRNETMHALERERAPMHSRRIAFKVHPVSRTPSFVNRPRIKLATRLVARFTKVSFRCAR